MAKQGPWPPTRYERECAYQGPDGIFRSDRPLVGPLRLGTAAGVGPRGRGSRNMGSSDFGVDRMELPPVDSIGVKYPETDPPVQSISRRR